MKKSNSNSDFYWSMTMLDHKDKLIFERKKERYDLKKRIKYLEMELQGMGVSDFELDN